MPKEEMSNGGRAGQESDSFISVLLSDLLITTLAAFSNSKEFPHVWRIYLTVASKPRTTIKLPTLDISGWHRGKSESRAQVLVPSPVLNVTLPI